ncbi:reverse transcriptase/maturase family protein [Myxococcota bacterium]|nr:reverse transcriptase/maturase family protein [Myxococcota bacterium]
MRRVGGLWAEVVAFENLHRSVYQVLRGKRGRASAGELFARLEGELFALQRALVEKSYRPGDYQTFWIFEPKRRLISAAPLLDRVVHHALVGVLEPHFERRFIFHSYACRRGKGTHRALEEFVRRGRVSRFVLKMDVAKFFPSIDHEILKQIVRRTVKDPDVLWLVDTIIDGSNPQEPTAGYFAGDDLFSPLSRRRGIPIGNLTSQFLANVYLNELDHFVTDRLGHGAYLRYVDDFCVFGDDKSALRNMRESIRGFLGDRLRLKLNERKSRLRRISEGVEFLGFVVSSEQIRLNQTAIRRHRRRMRRHRTWVEAGRLTQAEAARSLEAWAAHAAHGTTWRLRQRILSSSRQ